MMAVKRIGVIAGTAVDSGMGADFLRAKGVMAHAYPVSVEPREQTMFQIAPETERTARIREIILQTRHDGMDAVMVYCNSLSASVDMDKLAVETGALVVTPLQVYRNYARHYRRLGVLAANNLALAGIEQAILQVHQKCDIFGVSLLPMVIAIEKNEPPDAIVERFALKNIFGFFAHLEVNAVILGCTHFPYLYEALLGLTPLPLLNPAEDMLARLV